MKQDNRTQWEIEISRILTENQKADRNEHNEIINIISDLKLNINSLQKDYKTLTKISRINTIDIQKKFNHIDNKLNEHSKEIKYLRNKENERMWFKTTSGKILSFFGIGSIWAILIFLYKVVFK